MPRQRDGAPWPDITGEHFEPKSLSSGLVRRNSNASAAATMSSLFVEANYTPSPLPSPWGREDFMAQPSNPDGVGPSGFEGLLPS